jgi:hypothetical protein
VCAVFLLYGAWIVLRGELLSSLASTRGGKCVAKTYRNSQTFAIPNSVKRGSWCPECWLSARS